MRLASGGRGQHKKGWERDRLPEHGKNQFLLP